MERKEFSPEELSTKVDDTLRQAWDAQVPVLRGLAELQEKRAERLAAVDDRLRAALGEDHPRVSELHQTAVAAETLRGALSTTAERISRRPKVGDRDWLLFGRVLDSNGRPVREVIVQVFDRD